MTIKEIETRAGMSRANVRFYEAEGLLSPARKENGYRDYSEADLRELRRIRLLRSLRVSLDDIRALQKGEKALDDVLAGQLTSLADTQDELELAKEICRAIRREGAAYGELEAEKYLLDMEKGTPPASPAPIRSLAPPAPVTPPPELKADVLPRLRAPWRRYFARLLDGLFFRVLLGLVLIGAFNLRPVAGGAWVRIALLQLAAMVLGLFLEPLFLMLFGGTPGKLLLGLRVTDENGRRLSYPAALVRSFGALVYARGLELPILDLICLVRSYRRCMRGAEEDRLPWEKGSEELLRDEALWRSCAWVAALLALVGVYLAADSAAATIPLHRAPLTVSAFSENFNRLADYRGLSFGARRLDWRGEWAEVPNLLDNKWSTDYVTYWRWRDGLETEPAFTYTFSEENGEKVLTGLSFSVSREKEGIYAHVFTDEATLAILSFLRAQPLDAEGRRELRILLHRMEAEPYQSLELPVGDYTVTIDAELVNYTPAILGNGFTLFPQFAETVLIPSSDYYAYSYSLDVHWTA